MPKKRAIFGRGKKNGHKWQRNADHDFPASTSTSTTSDENESDIPGFYYDKEKKAYFKILPNTMSSVSSFVTKETIKKKKTEEKRLADINKLDTRQSGILKAALFSTSQKTFAPSNVNVAQVLSKFQCGQVTCENFRTHLNRHRCMTLQAGPEVVSNRDHRLDSLQKMISSTSSDYLVCVWSVKSSVAECIQLYSVAGDLKSCQKPSKENQAGCSVGVSETTSALSFTRATPPVFKKVSSLCWASSFPKNNGSNSSGANMVLWTGTCPVGYSPTIAYIYNLDAPPGLPVSVFELNLGFNTVWSSAWHNFQSWFSVGSERKCHLIDAATRRTWIFYTCDSDPLAQIFSSTDRHKMYNGTRSGLILGHDFRCQGNKSIQQQMRQRKGIGCLKLMRDENYILASDFSGDIVRWDQRMGRPVSKYKGLVNSHYQLPFHLDETEHILCSAGSDSYTKVWDVQTGDLLRSIPPPIPSSEDSFPIALYSHRWGNVNGNSGLIVGIKNLFKVYC